MNLATAWPTFASPHNKRWRKKLAVFKGKETSHEPFLNGQTNALHLHIMNGPYYSKSKCHLWDKRRSVAECLSETRKLVTRESARFPYTATGHRPPRLSRREGFLPAQGLDPDCKAILFGHRPPN